MASTGVPTSFLEVFGSGPHFLKIDKPGLGVSNLAGQSASACVKLVSEHIGDSNTYSRSYNSTVL
jgi:hypothetical protein